MLSLNDTIEKIMYFPSWSSLKHSFKDSHCMHDHEIWSHIQPSKTPETLEVKRLKENTGQNVRRLCGRWQGQRK